MSDHRLQVVETLDPTTRVIDLSGPDPIMTATGPDNYFCGACGNVLIASVRPLRIPSTLTGQAASTVIRCGKCKVTNAVV